MQTIQSQSILRLPSRKMLRDDCFEQWFVLLRNRSSRPPSEYFSGYEKKVLQACYLEVVSGVHVAYRAQLLCALAGVYLA